MLHVVTSRIPETILIDQPIEETATKHLPITEEEREVLTGLSLYSLSMRADTRASPRCSIRRISTKTRGRAN